MEEKKDKLKEMQEAFSVYMQNVEPIIVDGTFICYVHGSYFEDYYATYKKDPNEIVKEYLLSKGRTVEEGLLVISKECEEARESISFWITHYLDMNEKGMEYNETLLIEIHEMRRTPQYQEYIASIIAKYPLSEFSCG